MKGFLCEEHDDDSSHKFKSKNLIRTLSIHKSISLVNQSLTNGLLEELIAHVKRHKQALIKVRTVNLRKCSLSDNESQSILELVFLLPGVRVLSLRGNTFSDDIVIEMLLMFIKFGRTFDHVAIDTIKADAVSPSIMKQLISPEAIPPHTFKDPKNDPCIFPLTSLTGNVVTTGVIILGSGIAGGALLTSLKRQNIAAVCIEKDLEFNSRAQGYGLTIQQGNQALAAMGIGSTEGFLTSHSHFVFDDKGAILAVWGPGRNASLINNAKSNFNKHIPRQELRRLLIDGVNDQVMWGCDISCISDSSMVVYLQSRECIAATPPQNKNVFVKLTDGREVHGKCIVDCCGIFSPIRNLLVPYPPLRYLGIFVILGVANDTPLTKSRILQLSDGQSRIFLMPFNDGQLMWQLSRYYGEEEGLILKKNKGSMKELALRWLKNYDSTVCTIVEGTNEDVITGTPVYDREAEEFLRIPSEESLYTTIGDSAHPMSPFKGQGANQALIDAWNLGVALSSCRKEVELAPLLRLFENSMMKRSFPKVVMSNRGVSKLHTPEFLNPEYHFNRKAMPTCLMERIQKYKDMGLSIQSDPAILDNITGEDQLTHF